MLELKVSCKGSQHINDFDTTALPSRNIIVAIHCYGCTAGSEVAVVALLLNFNKHNSEKK
jgi:hypothetical protein